MQNFTVFDIIVVSITLLLGLKGIIRGFIKEVFALVGLIGGIFIGSRVASDIGKEIAPILGLENQATIQLIGFILGFIGVWVIVYILGIVLSKIFKASGLGLFDRIFGFIFGSAKVFLIFSVIAFGFYQIKSFKSLMDSKVANSITFPFLIEAGGFIVKLDPSKFTKMIKEKTEDNEDNTQTKEKSLPQEIKDNVEEIKKTTLESGSAVVKTIKKTVDENVKKMSNQIEKKSSEIKDDTNSNEN